MLALMNISKDDGLPAASLAWSDRSVISQEMDGSKNASKMFIEV